ncbi:CAP domain-containing protein [Streptomyces sp. NPDC060194]|uniref:CAP domain-containing protein n=1 Tax=Streptomyces sp. NPDC060194 TaxID=3347069 RepID=UPI003663D399
MGRHRRSDAGRAAAAYESHDFSAHGYERRGFPDPTVTVGIAGGTHARGAVNPDGTYAVRRHRGGSRRKPKAATVRTGLLGTSAALAMGAVAMASGLLPGGSEFGLETGSGDGAASRVQADAPGLGAVTTLPPADRPSEPASRGEDRPQAPSLTPSPGPSRTAPGAPASPSGADDDRARESAPAPGAGAGGERTEAPGRGSGAEPGGAASSGPAAGDREKAPAPARPAPSSPPVETPGTGSDTAPAPIAGAPSAAEAQVLTLVNEERARAGCRPLRADTGLSGLAEEFSEDMAERGFFSHTNPDGESPWDRAEKAGVKRLGGENIARGQADAAAVMQAWMDSPGHRANILNCDYKTLGVGAHFAPGGPWWTQNFGF